MKIAFRSFLFALGWLAILSIHSVAAQPTDYIAPRDAWGNPDINGIWQAMGTAYWDLETHSRGAGGRFVIRKPTPGAEGGDL